MRVFIVSALVFAAYASLALGFFALGSGSAEASTRGKGFEHLEACAVLAAGVWGAWLGAPLLTQTAPGVWSVLWRGVAVVFLAFVTAGPLSVLATLLVETATERAGRTFAQSLGLLGGSALFYAGAFVIAGWLFIPFGLLAAATLRLVHKLGWFGPPV